MTTALPQYSAPNSPFVGADGRLTYAANVFLRDLWLRVGGSSAMSNAELADLIAAIDDATTRADGANAAVCALRDELKALQAGEVVMQPFGADQVPFDVMQTSPVDVFAGEITCQI